MGVSKNRDTVPQNGWFRKQKPIKNGWFGGKTHYFRETSIYNQPFLFYEHLRSSEIFPALLGIKPGQDLRERNANWNAWELGIFTTIKYSWYLMDKIKSWTPPVWTQKLSDENGSAGKNAADWLKSRCFWSICWLMEVSDPPTGCPFFWWLINILGILKPPRKLCSYSQLENGEHGPTSQCYDLKMDVSEKIVVPPKSSILIGFSIINHPF